AVTPANAAPVLPVHILTGAGPAFCAGGDLKSLRDRTGIGPRQTGGPAETRSNYRRGVHSVIRALAETEVVTIAAINGAAIGLGRGLAIILDVPNPREPTDLRIAV